MADVPEGGILGLVVGGATVWAGRALAIALKGWIQSRLKGQELDHETQITTREAEARRIEERTDRYWTALERRAADLEESNRALLAEAEQRERRCREELDARDRRHREECDALEATIRRLRAERDMALDDPGRARWMITPSGTFGREVVDEARAARVLAGLHVLLVEDDPQALRFTRRLLEMAGARVDEAVSFDEARAAYESERPDAIVADVALKGTKTGNELSEFVRRDELMRPGHRAVILIVSGYSRPEDEERALSAGADGFLAKDARLEPDAAIRALAKLLHRE